MAAPARLVVKNQFGEQQSLMVIGGSFQSNCRFAVDSANVNGLGIKNLAGSGINAVYMHTSATAPAASPNPAVGYIALKLNKPHSSFLAGSVSIVSPNSGTSINATTGVTAGNAYVITAVGTTTTAQWQALGLPVGLIPAVGVAWVAKTTATGAGTGTMQIPAATGSTIVSAEFVGDPNASVMTSDKSGSWFVIQLLAPTSSSVTTLKPTAPLDGSMIFINLEMGIAPEPLI